MMPEQKIEPGLYRHFKGNLYKVLMLATHTETEEVMVVYQAMYGEGKLWTRPLELFAAKVDTEKYPDCRQTYRYERIGEK